MNICKDVLVGMLKETDPIASAGQLNGIKQEGSGFRNGKKKLLLTMNVLKLFWHGLLRYGLK